MPLFHYAMLSDCPRLRFCQLRDTVHVRKLCIHVIIWIINNDILIHSTDINKGRNPHRRTSWKL